MSKSYEESGVNIEAGYKAISKMKSHIESTAIEGVMNPIGSFGGMFDMSNMAYKNPVMVSGTDGVGTKLLVAQQANIHHTIGIDLVAMCVNDIITSGATAYTFLDYIATGKLDPTVIESIMSGIAEGCRQANCAIIGGETAEMPGMYQKNHYDLAGFATGIVEKHKIISPNKIKQNDCLIGIASSGLHSNGFSLVRHILFDMHSFSLDDTLPSYDKPLSDILLTPTLIYTKAIKSLLETVSIHGIAHITGGGLYENVPRILPGNFQAVILKDSFPTHKIFSTLKNLGNISLDEMYHVFNMGIGMVLAISKQDQDEVLRVLDEQGYQGYTIGFIQKGTGVVIQ